MTQVPEIPEEQRSFEDEGVPQERQQTEPNGHAPQEAEMSAAEANPHSRFGTLKQYALNRWRVRDREG